MFNPTNIYTECNDINFVRCSRWPSPGYDQRARRWCDECELHTLRRHLLDLQTSKCRVPDQHLNNHWWLALTLGSQCRHSDRRFSPCMSLRMCIGRSTLSWPSWMLQMRCCCNLLCCWDRRRWQCQHFHLCLPSACRGISSTCAYLSDVPRCTYWRLEDVYWPTRWFYHLPAAAWERWHCYGWFACQQMEIHIYLQFGWTSWPNLDCHILPCDGQTNAATRLTQSDQLCRGNTLVLLHKLGIRTRMPNWKEVGQFLIEQFVPVKQFRSVWFEFFILLFMILSWTIPDVRVEPKASLLQTNCICIWIKQDFDDVVPPLFSILGLQGSVVKDSGIRHLELSKATRLAARSMEWIHNSAFATRLL